LATDGFRGLDILCCHGPRGAKNPEIGLTLLVRCNLGEFAQHLIFRHGIVVELGFELDRLIAQGGVAVPASLRPRFGQNKKHLQNVGEDCGEQTLEAIRPGGLKLTDGFAQLFDFGARCSHLTCRRRPLYRLHRE
jgi:hypothetical protein